MTAKSARSNARNLEDYRDEYDKDVYIPKRVRALFDELLKEGPENWRYESEVTKLVSVSQSDIAIVRSNFEKHIVEARPQGGAAKRIYFADPKVAERVRAKRATI